MLFRNIFFPSKSYAAPWTMWGGTDQVDSIHVGNIKLGPEEICCPENYGVGAGRKRKKFPFFSRNKWQKIVGNLLRGEARRPEAGGRLKGPAQVRGALMDDGKRMKLVVCWNNKYSKGKNK